MMTNLTGLLRVQLICQVSVNSLHTVVTETGEGGSEVVVGVIVVEVTVVMVTYDHYGHRTAGCDNVDTGCW